MFRRIFIAVVLAALPAIAAEPRWIEVKSRNFTVVSNASEKQARTVLNQFEQIRALFQETYNVRVDPGKPIVILAVRDEKTLRELLPEYWETKDRARPAGVFQAGADKHFVALRTDASGERPFHTVYHEYVHLLTKLNFKDLPVWLNEGLAEFYGNTLLREKEVLIGGIAEHQVLYLREQRLIPLAEMLVADHKSPYYNLKNKASVFYGMSWALVHYLLLGDGMEGGKFLQAYVVELEKGKDPMQAAQSSLPALPLVEKGLRNYIGQNSFKYIRSKSPVQVESLAVTVRDLPEAELLAVRGDFHAHTGRPKEAEGELEQALRLDPKLSLANEGMAFLKFRQQNRAEALRYLEQAVQLDSKSFMAHYYYAMLSDISGSADLELAEKHLRRAIELNAEFAPAYSNLASVIAPNDKKREEAFKLAYKAMELEPGEPIHKLSMARVLMMMKRFEQAERLAKNVIDTADDGGNINAAESMLKYIAQYRQYQESARQREAAARARAEAYENRAAEQRDTAGPSTPAGANAAGGARANTYEGVVQKVGCKGPQIDVTLQTAEGVVTVGAPDWKKVLLIAPRGAVMPGFEICRDIDEMKVRAVYDPARNGQLISIEIGR